MKPIYLKENFHYSKELLFKIISKSETPSKEEIDDCLDILNKLKNHGIIYLLKYDNQQLSLTEEYDEKKAINLSKIKDDGKPYEIMFRYVGVLYVNGRVIFVCPKYLNHQFILHDNESNLEKDPLLSDCSKYNEDDLFKKMKIINKVILKYERKKMDSVDLDFNSADEKEHTRLYLLLYFLSDYFDNGLFSKRKEIRTINGNGEIDWNRTINNSFPLLNNNRPYYTNLSTRQRVEDEFDFFKELHRCIITQCTKELRTYGLLDFFDLTGEELTEKSLEDLGEKQYILNKIEMEEKVQFNTRNLILLNSMKTFVSMIYNNTNLNDDVVYYGTKTFCTIWEKICGEILDNKLESNITTLPYKLSGKYGSVKLNNILPNISWNFNFETKTKSQQALGGLIPDIISIPDEKTFIIFDAKYYSPNIADKDSKVSSVPGVTDVNKQYLYQLAFKDFIKDCGVTQVANCFIMPTEDIEVYDKKEFKGTVSASLFDLLKADFVDLQVRFIPADEVFSLYLSGEKYNINNLELFEEV